MTTSSTVRSLGPSSIRGRRLPPGGVVGVCSPSSPTTSKSDVLRGIEWWESNGFKVKLSPHVFEHDFYLAGSAEARAEDLMLMFADPEVDIVQCTKGGYGSAQMLPYLDFDQLLKTPKAFIGASDPTSLHVPFNARGLVTLYGPGLRSVGAATTTEFTRQHLLRIVTGDGTGAIPANPDDPYLHTMSGGQVTGRIVGGDLYELRGSLGTPWDFRADGNILFFEDVNAPPWQVDGMLDQLLRAGVLGQVRGVVVGEMTGCDWSLERPSGGPASKSLEQVLEYYLEPLDVPVLYGHPLGHGKHHATLPLGVQVEFDADQRRLTVTEPALD